MYSLPAPCCGSGCHSRGDGDVLSGVRTAEALAAVALMRRLSKDCRGTGCFSMRVQLSSFSLAHRQKESHGDSVNLARQKAPKTCNTSGSNVVPHRSTNEA